MGRAIERSIDERTTGPILLTSRSTRNNLDRHPNYILAAYMALRHLTDLPVVPS